MIELLNLYLGYFKIGFFSFGGGYSSIGLIEETFITGLEYITIEEFADILTIAEMTPGPVAINAATFVGSNVAGFLGSIVATLGFVTAPLIICIILGHIFFKYQNLVFLNNVLKYVKPVIIGIIGAAAIKIFNTAILGQDMQIDFNALIIFATCMFFTVKKDYGVKTIIPISGILGVILYSVDLF